MGEEWKGAEVGGRLLFFLLLKNPKFSLVGQIPCFFFPLLEFTGLFGVLLGKPTAKNE